MNRKIAIIATLYLGVVAPQFARGATIEVAYTDGANVGFNDPLPVNDTTLGELRRVAFERAVDVFETKLIGSRPLLINASFDTTSEKKMSGPFAAARPSRWVFDKTAPPLPDDVQYPAALATLLTTSGDSVNGDWGSIDNGYHLTIFFNPDRDTSSERWYYGFDANPPGDDHDFISTSLHELIHGFGFAPQFEVEHVDLDGDGVKESQQATGLFKFDFPDLASTMMVAIDPNTSGETPLDVMTQDEMHDTLNLFTLNSDYKGAMYFAGPITANAAEWEGIGFPTIRNAKPQLCVRRPGPFYAGLVISHWANSTAPVIMRCTKVQEFRHIAEGREFMEDLGYEFTDTPPSSGPEAWVDFAYDLDEFGTNGFPFNTLAEAVDFVTEPGTIHIFSGSTIEEVTIDKEVTIELVNGPVTIEAP